MREGICGECLWYHEEGSWTLDNWYGFCYKQDKRRDDDAPACESLRAWHIPEHVSLYNQESMLFGRF